MSPATAFSTPDVHSFPTRRPPVSKDVFDLPPRRKADELVESYLFYVHTLYPFLHEPTFRSQYEALWGPSHQKDEDVEFMAILNLVFAMGCHFLSKSTMDTEMLTLEGQRFLKRAKALLRDDILNSRSLASVQALLILGQYVCLFPLTNASTRD
jgi:Fungal specific transcription factor domain